MIKRFDVFEEVVKEVVPFGNGSIVYTPKRWVGQTVRVILEAEPLNIKETIMKPLQPFLEHVKGVFLHGSFARREQSKDSDIDVLVVADKKFNLGKTGRIDFTITDETSLREGLNGNDPFYLYNILQDSKAVLNEELLQSFKGIRIDKHNFKWMLEEADSALRVVVEFLKLDKLEKRKKLDSTAIIYTMILRLRRFFLVECILEKKKHSNKEFKLFLGKKGLAEDLVERFYEIYRAERDERKTDKSVSIDEAEKLFEITTSELKKMKKEYKCQKRK